MSAAEGTSPSQTILHEGIGASQAAAAVGLDPWTPPIALYERLLGLAPEGEGDDKPAFRWGKLLEQPIRLAYVETTGVTIYVPPTSLFHPERAWVRASPDGIVVDPQSLEPGEPPAREYWLYGFEAKTADAFAADQWGPAGTDEVPLQYICQIAWSQHVTGLERWDLAVLIGGRDFRIYTIHRDLELEAELVAGVTAFWQDHVLAGIPPEPDHTVCTTPRKCFRICDVEASRKRTMSLTCAIPVSGFFQGQLTTSRPFIAK